MYEIHIFDETARMLFTMRWWYYDKNLPSSGNILSIFYLLTRWRPLLEMGLPQASPQRPVLRYLHPADSRLLQQVVDPTRWKA